MRIAKAVLTLELDGVDVPAQLQALVDMFKPVVMRELTSEERDDLKAVMEKAPAAKVEQVPDTGLPAGVLVTDRLESYSPEGKAETRRMQEMLAKYVLDCKDLRKMVEDAPTWELMWLYKTLLGIASPQADISPVRVMSRLDASQADIDRMTAWQKSQRRS